MVRVSFPKRGTTEAQPHWVSMADYHGVVVRIRGCSEVTLLLAEVLGNMKSAAYGVSNFTIDFKSTDYNHDRYIKQMDIKVKICWEKSHD